MKKKPELLAPAGDWSMLYTAIKEKADSVYFGIKGLNMRDPAPNFDCLELKKIMRLLHDQGKKGYLALNVLIYNRELDKVRAILEKACQAGVDAVILWDMAVLSLARQSGLPVHLSTQASVSNIEALRLYSSLGVERVILARECRLADIRNMVSCCKKEKITCEIETFVHGAMCLSISGRCFLSGYSFDRSANRGRCLQPCRREFLIFDTQEDASYLVGRDYLLSPKDLCTIDFIDKLISAGIKAFKIEGRMRSPEYVKVVTAAYRKAIDAFFAGRLDDRLKRDLIRKLKTVYNRGFSRGFYFTVPHRAVSRKLEIDKEKIYLGEVVRFFKKIAVAEIIIRNDSLRKGDTVLFYGRQTPASVARIEEMEIGHCRVAEAGKGMKAGVKLPFSVRPGDKMFLWKEKK